MPLPPAPSKRAALLSPEAFDAPARTSHKAARKTEAPPAARPAADKPEAGLDFESRGAALAPEATLDEEQDSFDNIEVLEDIAEPVALKSALPRPPSRLRGPRRRAPPGRASCSCSTPTC